MGYAIGMSPCYGCKRVFGYNPARVPSVIDPASGLREPICRECVDRANPRRLANGLEPIVPLPGAYDPAHESEL